MTVLLLTSNMGTGEAFAQRNEFDPGTYLIVLHPRQIDGKYYEHPYVVLEDFFPSRHDTDIIMLIKRQRCEPLGQLGRAK